MIKTLVLPFLHLGILVGVLFYYLKRPAHEFVRARYVRIGEELIRVRELLRSAQEKDEEFSSKLKAIDTEIAAVREQFKTETAEMRVRISQEAQRLSQGIVEDARLASQSMWADLKAEVLAQVGARIVQRAEQQVRTRLTGADQARLRQEFSHQVESV